MASVKLYGLALEFASKDLKRDRDIVMTAVKKHGLAICHVSNGLRGDKDIVLEAVKVNGQALELASLELQGDCDVVLEAAEHNSISLQHANLTRLARDNTKSPANICKLLSCFDSMDYLYTLVREKPYCVHYGLLQ